MRRRPALNIDKESVQQVASAYSRIDLLFTCNCGTSISDTETSLVSLQHDE